MCIDLLGGHQVHREVVEIGTFGTANRSNHLVFARQVGHLWNGEKVLLCYSVTLFPNSFFVPPKNDLSLTPVFSTFRLMSLLSRVTE